MRTLRSGGIVRSRRSGKLVMYSMTDRGEALLSAMGGELPETVESRG